MHTKTDLINNRVSNNQRPRLRTGNPEQTVISPRRSPWAEAGTLFRTDPQAPHQAFPLIASRIAAGFPSPADDYVDQSLDLNTHLIEHPAASFFIRVKGDSMIGAGIHDGDLLIVDRALSPQDGKIVIAAIEGELTVKRLRIRKGAAWLVPDNPAYPPLPIREEQECLIWGVVTQVIHAV